VLPVERMLLSPRPGPGVCVVCFNLTDGYQWCYACAHGRNVLDAVAPISYSVAHESLHRALFGYKRLPEPLAHSLRAELTTILSRFLARHERCLARTAGTPGFDLVATVPSGERYRDQAHPLPRIVTQALGATAARPERMLCRSAFETGDREYDFLKYLAVRPLDGEAVLLVDDTWTTGANAQSAAAALKAAGAGRVAAVAIGRHVNREWGDNDRRLLELEGRFDWRRCALCAPDGLRARAGLGDSGGHAVSPWLAVAEKQDVGFDRLDRLQ
jgi:predicted amidophosphoribosyltransferase